ncbi:MAG: hypothetical protein HKN03_16960 [Acidimicrobiales bacterium]|nr:hypothetical protein [Acidimicrobiales bacterium]
MRTPAGLRFSRLLPGLFLFGLALALTVEADLGTNPWTVFHQGASERLGVSIGTMVIVTGAILLLLFRPIREPLGLGTLLNVAVIGPAVDLSLYLIPDLTQMWQRIGALAVSPVLLGLASGLYIGAGLGPGPRDGLMTALERRGVKVSTARLLIETTALTVGWLLGGTVGVGTVYFAFSVSFWVRVFLPPLRIDPLRVG